MPDASSLYSESAIIGRRMPALYIQRTLLSGAGYHFKFAEYENSNADYHVSEAFLIPLNVDGNNKPFKISSARHPALSD